MFASPASRERFIKQWSNQPRTWTIVSWFDGLVDWSTAWRRTCLAGRSKTLLHKPPKRTREDKVRTWQRRLPYWRLPGGGHQSKVLIYPWLRIID